MKVSVIIPVYNAQEYLEKAVLSALALPEVEEVILVEDKSSDNSYAICKELVAKYEKVQLFIHPNHENKGAGASRNKGIAAATAPFITFLDADDYFLPNRFEGDKRVFEQYAEADGCYSALGVTYYNAAGKQDFNDTFKSELTTVNAQKNPNPDNLLLGLTGGIKDFGHIHLNTLTLKKEALLQSKIVFPALRLHQDTDFIIRLSATLRLYPAAIHHPVAIRGIHDNNRITKGLKEDYHIQFERKEKLWANLLDWYQQEANKDPKVVKQLSDNLLLCKLLGEKDKRMSIFLKYVSQEKQNLLQRNDFFSILNYYTQNPIYVRFFALMRKIV